MNKLKEFMTNFKRQWPRYKAKLFGSGDRNGIVYYIVVYFLSITFAFVFIYPIFYMFMISLMSNTDLVDSTILWIPSEIYWKNYSYAVKGLSLDVGYLKSALEVIKAGPHSDINHNLTYGVELRKLVFFGMLPIFATFIGGLYTEQKGRLLGVSLFALIIIMFLPKSYIDTLYVAGTVTFATVVSSALIGYGLARFKFKLKGVIFVLILILYILPKMLLFIPRSLMFFELGIKGTMLTLWVPAFLGVGVQATFFILIFYQFFSMMPGQIEESAYLDGASSFEIFVKIAIPMALPAFVIAFVYGFAVNWNEMFFTNAYLNGYIETIPMKLQAMQSNWGNIADYSTNTDGINIDFTESKSFAGTILSVFPLVIMYGFIQRYFIESIDKSGIAGE